MAAGAGCATAQSARGLWNRRTRILVTPGEGYLALRALVIPTLILATCLLLAVVTLAMLRAELYRPMAQEPESVTGKMPGSFTAQPCEETAPWTRTVEVPEPARISQC